MTAAAIAAIGCSPIVHCDRVDGPYVMTNIFNVIGQHREEPSWLLLVGAYGHYYAYATEDAEPREVEPNDQWVIDSDVPEPTTDL